MGDNSSIQWTNATWNPVTGCTKVSQGCKNCYAEALANRLWARQYPPNADGSRRRFTDIRLHPDRLELPLRWKKPRMIFVNSVSDLFHEQVPFDFILRVWITMAQTPQHTYQILTKRPDRMARFVTEWLPGAWALATLTGLATEPIRNAWLGVSVEDQAAADLRVPLLLQTPAAVRFLSCEPLLGPVDLVKAVNQLDWLDAASLKPGGINWVIVGGESGTSARPFLLDWGRDILNQCRRAGVPCFMKQLGAKPCVISQAPKTLGAKVVLKLNNNHGGNMDEWPLDLRVREFPKAVPA